VVKLYRTAQGVVLQSNSDWFRLRDDWDDIINRRGLPEFLIAAADGARGSAAVTGALASSQILAPIGAQEVWAAGVTYYRSRTARIDESQEAGGGSFYDRVYSAERPELFFKASPWRVRGPGQPVRIRRDARWSVPEPELALVINGRAEIVGYTIGNDVSSRDIEGENPLYLPQAKVYDGSCALGPGLLVTPEPLPPDTSIELRIQRSGDLVYEGSTRLSQMRRSPEELVSFLYRETSFPQGSVLLTGTGIVPPDAFTLQLGDEIEIRIEPIGILCNTVA
jgi:2-dehydro-3-deoxy-D-arabinonate dehydratase